MNSIQSNRIDSRKQNVGLNGFESMLFITISIVILMISLITTLANIFIISKLKLLPNLEPFTFTDLNAVIFNKDVIVEKIHLKQNIINKVHQIRGNVSFQVGSSSLNVDNDGIKIEAKNGFKVFSKTTGKQFFPPNFSELALPLISSLIVVNGLKNVHKVRSPTDQNLQILSNQQLKIKGNNGIYIDGKKVLFKSNSIYLNSVNNSIIFDSANGDYFLNFDEKNILSSKEIEDKLPINNDVYAEIPAHKLQYKLCVCADSGKVFKLLLKDSQTSCSDVRFPVSKNPCPKSY